MRVRQDGSVRFTYIQISLVGYVSLRLQRQQFPILSPGRHTPLALAVMILDSCTDVIFHALKNS
jgi:hypothetical protein